MNTLIELDARRRTSLGRVGKKEHTRYQVEEHEDGTIVLTPAVVISERELATLSNPEVMASIDRGMNQAEAGQTQPLDEVLEELGLEHPDSD